MNDADRCELACWHSMFTSPEALAAGARFTHLGQGGVFSTGAVPHVMYNRGIGVPRELWPDATALLDASGQPWFLHDRSAEAPPGLVRYPRSWVKLHRAGGLAVRPEPPPGLVLRDARPEEADAVARIFCDAFDVPAGGRPLARALVGRTGWQTLVVADGAEVVGIGLLFVHGVEGYFAGGATRPSHRQRGVQRALVQARLARAAELGLRDLWTETGEEKAGEEQHSYRNLVRSGFVPVGVRHNFCRPNTQWSAPQTT